MEGKKELKAELYCFKNGKKVRLQSLSQKEKQEVFLALETKWKEKYATLEGYEVVKKEPEE